MTAMKAVMTEEGKPAMMGRCRTCKTELLSRGGPLVTEAQSLRLHQSIAPRPVVVRSSTLTRSTTTVHVTAQLTDIRGIAAPRARQLIAAGIDSVEKLAASTPETVAKIKFITPTMAAHLIEEAKRLIES